MKLQFKLFLPYIDLKEKAIRVLKDTGHGIAANTVITLNEGRVLPGKDELIINNHPVWGNRNLPLDDILFTNITKKDLEVVSQELEVRQKALKNQIAYMEKNNLTQISPKKFFEEYLESVLKDSSLSDVEKSRKLLVYMR